MDREEFEFPSAKYRAKPFWSLNGKLEKKELENQIEIFKEMGFGGAFLHSRTGLATEYMSEEWMDRIGDCIKKLTELGMEAWLYDEDRWPSGTCGGIVAEDPRYRLKSMVAQVLDGATEDFKTELPVLGIFDCVFDGENSIRSFSRYQKGAPLQGKAVAIVVKEMQKEPFYNGFCYIDTLAREPVELFIKLTHEAYKKRFGDLFGKQVLGIFTDEPHRGSAFNGFGFDGVDREMRVPYTYKLFDTFYKRWGYSLEENLPLLWFKYKNSEFNAISYHFTETVLSLFLENFARPYFAWCKENKLKFTGHILHEDSLAAITSLCGSMMRFYEYMDIPGMDNLTVGNTCLPVPKMVSSVARQMGKKECLSELYAAIGWQATFEDHKAVADWQILSGITLRCPHLSWYTMGGAAKRDYPASLNKQAIFYKEYAYVENYLARLNGFVNDGDRQVELLVIHPIESAWGLSHAGAYANCFRLTESKYLHLEKTYFEIANGLTRSGLDFDFGDEEIMSRLASVKEGRLFVGECSYAAVLLPELITIRSSTLKLLEEFIVRGGQVFVYGKMPAYLDAQIYDFSEALRGCKLVKNVKECAEKLKETLHPLFEIDCDRSEFITSLSKEESDYRLAIVNLDREMEREAKIRLRGEYAVSVYDARTGSVFKQKVCYADGTTVIEKCFAPTEELLLAFSKGRQQVETKKREGRSVPLPEAYRYTLKEDNVLVLDRVSYSLNGEDFSEYEDILYVDGKLRKEYGLTLREGNMYQPWFAEKYGLKSKRKFPLRLRFIFNAESIPEKLWLVGEGMEYFTIALNGERIAQRELKESATDVCYKKLSLPTQVLKMGENELEMFCEMGEDVPLENFYLTGNFGVRAGSVCTICALKDKLSLGDVTEQGLPFYAGEIVYHLPCEKGRYAVELEVLHGAYCKVYGKETETLAFRPLRCEVDADGEIGVSVSVTQKNTFGPLHKKESVGSPGDFMPDEKKYVREYVLLPQGIKTIRAEKIG